MNVRLRDLVVYERGTRRYRSGVSQMCPGRHVVTQVLTQGSEVHQTWEGDDPVTHGINEIAVIELEE